MRENSKVDYSLFILLILSIILMFINFGGSFMRVGYIEPIEKVGVVNAEVTEKTSSGEQV